MPTHTRSLLDHRSLPELPFAVGTPPPLSHRRLPCKSVHTVTPTNLIPQLDVAEPYIADLCAPHRYIGRHRRAIYAESVKPGIADLVLCCAHHRFSLSANHTQSVLAHLYHSPLLIVHRSNLDPTTRPTARPTARLPTGRPAMPRRTAPRHAQPMCIDVCLGICIGTCAKTRLCVVAHPVVAVGCLEKWFPRRMILST